MVLFSVHGCRSFRLLLILLLPTLAVLNISSFSSCLPSNALHGPQDLLSSAEAQRGFRCGENPLSECRRKENISRLLRLHSRCPVDFHNERPIDREPLRMREYRILWIDLSRAFPNATHMHQANCIMSGILFS